MKKKKVERRVRAAWSELGGGVQSLTVTDSILTPPIEMPLPYKKKKKIKSKMRRRRKKRSGKKQTEGIEGFQDRVRPMWTVREEHWTRRPLLGGPKDNGRRGRW